MLLLLRLIGRVAGNRFVLGLLDNLVGLLDLLDILLSAALSRWIEWMQICGIHSASNAVTLLKALYLTCYGISPTLDVAGKAAEVEAALIGPNDITADLESSHLLVQRLDVQRRCHLGVILAWNEVLAAICILMLLSGSATANGQHLACVPLPQQVPQRRRRWRPLQINLVHFVSVKHVLRAQSRRARERHLGPHVVGRRLGGGRQRSVGLGDDAEGLHVRHVGHGLGVVLLGDDALHWIGLALQAPCRQLARPLWLLLMDALRTL